MNIIEKSPRFEDFPVSEEFEGFPALPDFPSSPEMLEFATVINNGSKTGPNFAGHYTIIEWGCGSNCQSGVVVNAEGGAIYNLPISSYCSRKYKIDSNLLVLNPPLCVMKTNLKDLPYWLTTKYYKWENNQLELVSSIVWEDFKQGNGGEITTACA